MALVYNAAAGIVAESWGGSNDRNLPKWLARLKVVEGVEGNGMKWVFPKVMVPPNHQF